MFIETFGEACEKTGWLVDARVLMSNHYHLVLRTPQANLVAGMRWLQNTYTRRFNVRNQLWGHVFGGRYKAVLVESRVFFISTTCLRACSVLIHTKQRRTP
jgi:putative transposase